MTSDQCRGGNMCERWLDGYYLGKVWQTDEDIIMLCDGQVVKTHAVIARPANTRVTLAELEKVKGMPWGEKGAIHHGETQPAPVRQREADIPPDPVPAPRSFRINAEMLARFGYTPNCPQCQAMRRDVVTGTLRHNQVCRARLE